MARFFAGLCYLGVVSISLSVAAGDDAPLLGATKPAPLEVGVPIPDFTCLDDCGQQWKSGQHIGRKIVVIYFYPGDFTDGCTKQAQSFRDGLTRLEKLGVELIGVSGEEVLTHQRFKETYGLRHTLLADPDAALAQRLEIPVKQPAKPVKVRTRGPDGKPLMDNQGKKSIFIERKVTLPRWTLVIGQDGKLASKRMNVDPRTDVDEVVKIVEQLGR